MSPSRYGSRPNAQPSAASAECEETRSGLYFRLNVWGMGHAREIMSAIGMVIPTLFPVWPSLDVFGLEEEPVEPNGPEGSELDAARDALTDLQRAYLAAVRDTRNGDARLDGIPSYKFGSNDGWLVTSREITAALAVWESAEPFPT